MRRTVRAQCGYGNESLSDGRRRSPNCARWWPHDLHGAIHGDRRKTAAGPTTRRHLERAKSRAMNSIQSQNNPASLDHTSDPHFVAYYEEASLSEATLQRFRNIRNKSLSLLAAHGHDVADLRVADIGCGAGTQSLLWAELGHSVIGLDVNAPLVEVAQRRAAERGLRVDFRVGTATALPLEDSSVDVCLLPELLEHVRDWEACLREATRSLDVGGLLYVSTTNVLCPVQSEFNLPLYSWYPGFVKRRYERLAATTRPALANYAKYPA